MIKLRIPLIAIAMLVITLNAYSQQSASEEKATTVENSATDVAEAVEVLEPVESKPILTEESLWQDANSNLSLKSLGVYLAAYPNGKYSDDARSKSQALEEKAKDQKALAAYRQRRIARGLVLELGNELSEVKPYVRSMLNSCGYNLAEPHRFAKRVYPTMKIDGRIFNNQSAVEHVVKLDLSLVLKTKTREVKARDKMSSYRISDIDSHQAVLAAFEDVGAQMKAGGFCTIN